MGAPFICLAQERSLLLEPFCEVDMFVYWSSRESICITMHFARFVNHINFVGEKSHYPSGVESRRVLHAHQAFDCLVVSDEFEGSASQIVVVMFDCPDYS